MKNTNNANAKSHNQKCINVNFKAGLTASRKLFHIDHSSEMIG